MVWRGRAIETRAENNNNNNDRNNNGKKKMASERARAEDMSFGAYLAAAAVADAADFP